VSGSSKEVCLLTLIVLALAGCRGVSRGSMAEGGDEKREERLVIERRVELRTEAFQAIPFEVAAASEVRMEVTELGDEFVDMVVMEKQDLRDLEVGRRLRYVTALAKTHPGDDRFESDWCTLQGPEVFNIVAWTTSTNPARRPGIANVRIYMRPTREAK
jgi:hypothetical protein